MIVRRVLLSSLVIGSSMFVTSEGVALPVRVAATADLAPQGYHTVTVQTAGFTMAVPKQWHLLNLGRKRGKSELLAFGAMVPELAREIDQTGVSAIRLFAYDFPVASKGASLDIGTAWVIVSLDRSQRGAAESDFLGDVRSAAQQAANQVNQQPGRNGELNDVTVAGRNAVELLLTTTTKDGVHTYWTYLLLGNKGALNIGFAMQAGSVDPQDPTVQTMLNSVTLLR